MPERFENPTYIDPDTSKSLYSRLNIVESLAPAIAVTANSIEIGVATYLTAGVATEIATGLGLAEASPALTALARTRAIIPATAAMTYGDFLYGNMANGLTPDQSSALAFFQALTEGVTEVISPLEAKMFDPDYWAHSALDFTTRKQVIKSLFKEITGKEINEQTTNYLMRQAKYVFGKLASANYPNLAVKGAKSFAKGLSTGAQESVEEGVGYLINGLLNNSMYKLILNITNVINYIFFIEMLYIFIF